MNSTLAKIQDQLKMLMAQIQAALPNDEPLGIAHSTWNMPGLTRSEFIGEAQGIMDLIEDRGSDDVDEENEKKIKDYIRRLEHLRSQTVGQLWGGNGGQAASVFILTLQGLRKILEPALTRNGSAEAAVALRALTTKVRSMEARVNSLDPRTVALSTMVERIEHAYNAADQLPTDLESLSEARRKIDDLLLEALKNQGQLTKIRVDADSVDERLKQKDIDAQAVLERCETAYSAATSVGLSAAFNERSVSLSRSMWTWVAGLVAALAAGSVLGTAQLHTLSDLFRQPDVGASIVFLNLMLTLLSVGAPVWFAWLATKQIGQRFRLAEDYAFKASISRAYEGFRREAARVDKDMEARLLASALARLDELPLRLVETDNHGSPWHELAASDVVKHALRAVPGFAVQIKEAAAKALAPALSKGQSASSAIEDSATR